MLNPQDLSSRLKEREGRESSGDKPARLCSSTTKKGLKCAAPFMQTSRCYISLNESVQ